MDSNEFARVDTEELKKKKKALPSASTKSRSLATGFRPTTDFGQIIAERKRSSRCKCRLEHKDCFRGDLPNK